MLRKIIYAFLAVIGLIFANFLFSHFYYHRSLRATILERILWILPTRMRFKGNADEFEARMKEYEAVGEIPYRIPQNLHFNCSVTEKFEHGMQVFYLNESSPSDTIFFYIHGGGNCEQPSKQHWQFLDSIVAKTDARVIAPLYPLLPFHDYHDTFPAIAELYMETVSKNRPCRVVLAGDSSGGGIALAIAEDLVKLDYPQPDELILISPYVESLYTEENAKELREYEKVCPFINTSGCLPLVTRWAGGDENRADPHVSPIRGDMKGLGKTTIFVGSREAFYPIELNLQLKMLKEGVDADLIVGTGMNHDYPLFSIPEGRKARDTIARIIRRA